MRAAKFGVDMGIGALEEGFSQMMLGRSAPMTGRPTVGGAVGSLAVKYLVGEAKTAMNPNHFGLTPFDRAAVVKNPVMMSSQGRQHFQGKGAWTSRDIGLHQMQHEVMKQSYPSQFDDQSSMLYGEADKLNSKF